MLFYGVFNVCKIENYFFSFFFEFFNLDNDIIQIPLAIVIIGCLAIAFLLIVIFILLNDRARGEKIK